VPIRTVQEPWGEGTVSVWDTNVVALPYHAIGELFWLGVFLQDEYGWDQRTARGWVITQKSIPWINPIEIEPFRLSAPRPPRLNRHRIVIDAALDFPVKRISEILAGLQEVVEDQRLYPRIARPIEMAILHATYTAVSRNDGRAWEDVLDEWNQNVEIRSWRYESGREGTRRFAKDVRRTYLALIGKPLKWKRGPGKPRGDHE
jgi:hypothetical protein